MYINWGMFRKTLIFITLRVIGFMLALSASVILSRLGYDLIGDILFLGIFIYLVAMGVPEEMYVGIFEKK